MKSVYRLWKNIDSLCETDLVDITGKKIKNRPIISDFYHQNLITSKMDVKFEFTTQSCVEWRAFIEKMFVKIMPRPRWTWYQCRFQTGWPTSRTLIDLSTRYHLFPFLLLLLDYTVLETNSDKSRHIAKNPARFHICTPVTGWTKWRLGVWQLTAQ